MNIVFLDLDGVLVTMKSMVEGFEKGLGTGEPDPDAVARLIRLCRDESVRIVLSSSWRVGSSILDRLANWGIERSSFHDDWRTIDLGDAGIRGDEIAEWLSRHPEVEHFVILDDDDDFRADQLPHLVQSTFEEGFTEEHLEQATLILQ